MHEGIFLSLGDANEPTTAAPCDPQIRHHESFCLLLHSTHENHTPNADVTEITIRSRTFGELFEKAAAERRRRGQGPKWRMQFRGIPRTARESRGQAQNLDLNM